MNRVRLENRNFVDVTWDVDVVAATSDARRASDVVPTTFFAIPKPFKGHTGVIQRNAIKSWCQIAPEIEIILIGDEFGIAEVANEFGLLHIPTVDRNEHGTPLVNSAFAAARAASNSPVLVYCNCDVILLKDFSAAIDQLMKSELKQFLAFGRRTDLQVESEIDFESAETEFRLGARVAKEGRSSSIVCKEYFVFTRDLCASVPGFAVGRGNWDNWIVANARALGVPTVNLSGVVSAIHQQHGYSETSQKNRLKCYVSGAEARQNQRLAGGRSLIRGSSATWTLTPTGPRIKRWGWLNMDFWGDSFRFLRLVLDLLSNRR